MPQSNRKRVEQVGRWLQETFPTPYPVEIRLTKKISAARNASPAEKALGDDGETYRHGSWLIVRVSFGARRYGSSMTHTLLHEYGHAISWRQESVEHKRAPHDDEWALAYGRVFRAFYDENGWRDSKKY